MPHASLFEKPENIKAKRTSAGNRNSRYVTAVQAQREAKRMRAELKYTVFSKARIKKEYPPEKVQDLLQRAAANLKNMTTPSMLSPWTPQA